MKHFQREYQIVRILGKGSYGEVALARSRTTKQQFALKFYSLSQLSKINKLYSIKRAMKIQQSLHSDYIVRLYQYIYDNEKLLLRYQACQYGNLEEYIKRHKHRSEEINKQLICQMAEILQFLKSVQVIHRDIKPSNLVFGTNGHLKLIDFDEAHTFNKDLIKQEEQIKIIKMKYSGVMGMQKRPFDIKNLLQDQHSRSRQQTYVGTPCYMPPQMKQNRSYDQKGDLWSLGCIIFQLLIGETYYTEQDQQQNLSQSRKSQRITNRSSSLKEQGKLLLSSILCKNPIHRPNISEILSHPYLNQYRWNKSLRLKNQILIANELIQDLQAKKQQDDDGDVELRFSPFFSGFQILRQIKVYTIVLKKGWYFYSPFILKSNQKSLNFYDQLELNIQQSIDFVNVTSVICLKQYVQIHTNSSKVIRLKHIIPQMNQKLKQSIKYVLDAFKSI